jgi:deoxyribonuclease IV
MSRQSIKTPPRDDFKVGVHVSIAGGLTQAVQHARLLGCQTMQVFSKSPRGWAARPLDRDDVEQGRQLRDRIGIGPFAVHAAYLINLAASEAMLYERSIRSAIDEMERCHLIGADFLVIHVGCVREGQADGLHRVSEALKRILDLSRPETRLLLENTAGERGELGSRFEELAELLYRVGSDRLGICLDTCHTLAAGYDVRTPAAVRKVVRELDGTVGLPAIKLIHGNDSKKGLACHVDRHQHIGKGEIGSGGFQALLAHPRLRRIPIVLETPKTSDADDLRNLRTIRKLANRKLTSRKSDNSKVPARDSAR